MSKLFSLFTSYMIRPTIYKTVMKCVVAGTLLLAWDRYINNGWMSAPRDGGFFAAVCLFGLAWVAYLRLDGVKNPFSDGKKKKKKKRFHTADIADYADQHIVTFDELDDQEQIACSMCSSLVAGVLFLVLSLVMSFL